MQGDGDSGWGEKPPVHQDKEMNFCFCAELRLRIGSKYVRVIAKTVLHA